MRFAALSFSITVLLARTRSLAGCLLLGIALPAWSATHYVFTGSAYSIINNNTTCTVGTCVTYTTAMRLTGEFSTAAPLSPNLNAANIAPSVLSYSFNDGVNTIASGNPGSRTYSFVVSTNAQGAITAHVIGVQGWLTGISPHQPGDRLVEWATDSSSFQAAINNEQCTSMGTTPAGVPDACITVTWDTNTSTANAASTLPGQWVIFQDPIPTPGLSGPATAVLALLLALFAWGQTRRRSSAS
jgi:uncharacterized protein (TIGR03382 family)